MPSTDKVSENSEPLQRTTLRDPQPRFLIAQGRGRGWIVRDRLSKVGGIFISEAAARHFALEESAGHPEQIEVVGGAVRIELDLNKAA